MKRNTESQSYLKTILNVSTYIMLEFFLAEYFFFNILWSNIYGRPPNIFWRTFFSWISIVECFLIEYILVEHFWIENFFDVYLLSNIFGSNCFWSNIFWLNIICLILFGRTSFINYHGFTPKCRKMLYR